MQITLSAGLTTHHQEQKNLSKKNPGEEWNKSEKKKKTRCLEGEEEERVKPTWVSQNAAWYTALNKLESS